MNWLSVILTVSGLSVFETISSVDNAIINAEVLSTMSARGRQWFLVWGLWIAVVIVRGILPWLIVWATAPSLGPLGSLTASFSGSAHIRRVIERSSPILLAGGGTFLVLLFLHWLLCEDKRFGLPGEKYLAAWGSWFLFFAAIFIIAILGIAMMKNPGMALSAALGSAVFFVSHGFKASAEKGEEELLHRHLSDVKKLFYLEIIDATFSIDSVLGAFAFTLSIPLILIGNGLGALVVRQITIGNIHRVKKYYYLKNGAMYSIFFLGVIMLAESFGAAIPSWISPIVTIAIICFFYGKSVKELKMKPEALMETIEGK